MSLTVAAAAFREGYRLGRLRTDAELCGALENLGPHRTPFGVEGAAMALRLEASGAAREDRLAVLVRWAEGLWTPFVRLGAGCAAARLGEHPPRDPLEQDGFGFQLVLSAGVSGRPLGTGRPSMDRGQGRALWFLMGGDAHACLRCLAGVPDPGALWRGLGTACTFAGDPRGHAGLLAGCSGEHRDDLARGAREALALWWSLGTAPPRALRSARHLDG